MFQFYIIHNFNFWCLIHIKLFKQEYKNINVESLNIVKTNKQLFETYKNKYYKKQDISYITNYNIFNKFIIKDLNNLILKYSQKN